MRICDMMMSVNKEDCLLAIQILNSKGYSNDRVVRFLRNVRKHYDLDYDSSSGNGDAIYIAGYNENFIRIRRHDTYNCIYDLTFICE